MKNNIVRLLQIAAILPISASGVFAQEFFRDLGTSRSSAGFGPVYPSEFSYEDASPSGLEPLRPGQDLNEAQAAEEADRYNFAIGPVQFGLAAGVGIEFNDNITLADDDRISDFVFRPSLDLRASWRISDLNTMRLNIGASYAKYFDHSEFDSEGILFSPNSELAFTFHIGAIKLTIRDRFSYQEDNYSDPTISNTGAPYRRFENQAGIRLDWAVNDKFEIATGYDHYNLWTKGNEFDLEDRAIDTVFLRPAYQIAPGLKLGLSASYSFIDFDRDDRPDGEGLLVGPFIEWQLSEYTNLYLEGGYQGMTFDELRLSSSDENAINNILYNNDDTSTYYIKFEINNKPSDIFDHRLSFSKTTEIGFTSNSYDLHHVEYDANWKAFQHIEMGPTIFYEYYTTSGDLGETAHRFGAGVGIRYHFSNSLTVGLDYRYILKDSDLEFSDYRQNLAFFSIYYKF